MEEREEAKRQLVGIFRAEVEEHLGAFNKGLLALEEGLPEEERDPLLADLFRATHSIKGAARMMEAWELGDIAHRMEDILGAVRQGELSLAPQLFGVLFPALDTLQEALAAFLKGRGLPAQQRDELMSRLKAILHGEAEVEGLGDTEKGGRGGREKEEDFAASPPPALTPSPPHPVSASLHLPLAPAPHEQTIRVTTDKLDALMASAGELLTAHRRSEQRLDELRALQRRLAGWHKEWRQALGHFSRLQRRRAQGSDDGLVLDFLASNQAHLEAIHAGVTDLLREQASDHDQMALLADGLQDEVRRVRMLSIATLFDPFPRMVRDLTRERNKEVSVQIIGGETEVDRQVLEVLKDPLTHLLRNAVDHGIEPPEDRQAAGKPRRGTIRLQAAQKGSTVTLEVADDGAGINKEAVRQAAAERGLLTEQEVAELSDGETTELIFRSTLSTVAEATDLSGRGVGMDVVRQNLERLHGLVQVDTASGRGTRFTLTLPLTLATSHVILVGAGDEVVAIPTTTVERILNVDIAEVGTIEGKPSIVVNKRPLPLVILSQVLQVPQVSRDKALADDDGTVSVIVVGVAEKRVAFKVDGLHDTREVVVHSLGQQLSRVRNISGATILGSGQVVMILNVADLVKSVRAGPSVAIRSPAEVRQPTRRRVLVVDDSITTRTLEKNILENAGYQVLVAADGQEAWALVQSESLDLIVADVDMPRLDGFALTERVKTDQRFAELPVVLVTFLESRHDKIRGLEAGADAYFSKSTFDQRELLETIERLIG